MKDYRIMQAGNTSFFVEHFTTNMWGVFLKWRPLENSIGQFSMVIYFPTKKAAERYAKEHKEFYAGPKIVSKVR